MAKTRTHYIVKAFSTSEDNYEGSALEISTFRINQKVAGWLAHALGYYACGKADYEVACNGALFALVYKMKVNQETGITTYIRHVYTATDGLAYNVKENGYKTKVLVNS